MVENALLFFGDCGFSRRASDLAPLDLRGTPIRLRFFPSSLLRGFRCRLGHSLRFCLLQFQLAVPLDKAGITLILFEVALMLFLITLVQGLLSAVRIDMTFVSLCLCLF